MTKLFNVGKRIKHLRKAQDINGATLARLIDVDPSQISKIEQGKSNPSLDSLFKICEVLDITPAEFFSIEEKEMSPELRSLVNTTEHLTQEQIQLLNDFLKTFVDERPKK